MKRNALKETFKDPRGKAFFGASTVMLIAGLLGIRFIPNDFSLKSLCTMGSFILMVIFMTLFTSLMQVYQNTIDKEEAEEKKALVKQYKKSKKK